MFPYFFFGKCHVALPADLEFQGIPFTFIDIPHDCCVIYRSRSHVISIWGPTNIIHIFQVASRRQEKPILIWKLKAACKHKSYEFLGKKKNQRQIKSPAGASSTSETLLTSTSAAARNCSFSLKALPLGLSPSDYLKCPSPSFFCVPLTGS